MKHDIPHYDFHIHTKYLGCANATMEIDAIVRQCERLGVTALGITDHLNTLDKLDLHIPIKRDIESLDTNIAVYFGVELNFRGCDGEFAFSPEIKEQYGFQFAIGGIHGIYLDTYDLAKIVDIQHRHHLKTCHDPLVEVLVHPYNMIKKVFEKMEWHPFRMSAVPESYVRELGQTAKATGTAIEIHWRCLDDLGDEYVDFLSILAAEGACFSLGSDAHDINRLSNAIPTWHTAGQLNLSADRIWRPRGLPLKGTLPD